MEDIYQNQEGYDHNDEREGLQQVIQAKKEKFRVKIRQTKNKQLMQAKRMKLANGMQHIPDNSFNKNDKQADEKRKQEQMIAQQMLQNNVNMLMQMQQFSKEDVQRGIEQIIQYLLDGAFHQDLQQLIQVAGQLNMLLNIGQSEQMDISDMNLVKSCLLLILNITYYCDKQQMKYFSNKDILNTIMKLIYSEDIKVREYCLTTINNIIQEDEDIITYLMDRFIAQEIVSLVTTYALSDEILLDLASIIKSIVSNNNIPYSQASEFIVPIDELVEQCIQQGINEEQDNSALSELYECINVILNKEDSEEIYENFVLEFPRLLINLFDTVKSIQYNQQFNEMAFSVVSIIGVLLSGNINTTQKLIENNVYEVLKILIKHPKKEVRKEAVWSVSNLFVFSKVNGIKDYLVDLHFWESILDIAYSDNKSISKWAYVSILNALILNDLEFTDLILERFCESDIIKFIFEKLEDKAYSNVVISLLEALRSLIGYGEYCQKKNNYQENHIIAQIQRNNSRPVLEQCQYNNIDEDISRVSSDLLDKLF